MSEVVDGEYDVIYADPPWSYHNGSVPNAGVDHHYETMDIDDICSMEIPAADDCVLYMWATVTHAKEAFDVMDAWGFEYKTQAIWDKKKLGIGYWFRGEHELLYLGTRGDVSPPDPNVRRSSIFSEESTKHSRKPGSVRRYIEKAHPEARKLEMFARDGDIGWDLWGNEAPESKQSTLSIEAIADD